MEIVLALCDCDCVAVFSGWETQSCHGRYRMSDFCRTRPTETRV